MLLAVLTLVVVVVAWLLIEAARRAISARPAMPSADASNDAWVQYYSRLAVSARRTGDMDSVATYESMAETYRKLRDEQV